MPRESDMPTDLASRIEDLITLLTAVLDTHKNRDVAAQLQALVSEIEAIRVLMERRAMAIEQLFPSAEMLADMLHEQRSIRVSLDQVAWDSAWTRAQLDADVDGPI